MCADYGFSDLTKHLPCVREIASIQRYSNRSHAHTHSHNTLTHTAVKGYAKEAVKCLSQCVFMYVYYPTESECVCVSHFATMAAAWAWELGIMHGVLGELCVSRHADADVKLLFSAFLFFSLRFFFSSFFCRFLPFFSSAASVMNKHKSVLASYRAKHRKFNCI